MSLWKHLRRRLLRNRGDAGWGPRAFLTLRIARTAYPSQRPTMPADLAARLGPMDEYGRYARDHGDGTVTHVFIGTAHGSRDPRTYADDPREAWSHPLFVVGDPNETRWTWTTIHAATGAPSDDLIRSILDPVRRDHTSPGWEWIADVAAVHHAQRQWDSDVRRLGWCGEDVAGLFGTCEFWARTTYHADDATHYGVAFALRGYTRDFAIAAARLTRALRAEGARASWR